MLENAKHLKGDKLRCTDGELGRVQDFYFDDTHWMTRYLVVDTGNWLSGRSVLLSPYAITDVRHEEGEIVTSLTKAQIEDSPPLDSDKPVSRQFEENYYGFFGWPTYWAGPYVWGRYPAIERDQEQWNLPPLTEQVWDPNLRSTNAVDGYHIQASDGDIGHVTDFVIDTQSWSIRYMVIDTRNWWPGKQVLIAPTWITEVSWSDSRVLVTPTRELIKTAPEYVDGTPLSRDYERNLHQHYSQSGYWESETATARG